MEKVRSKNITNLDYLKPFYLYETSALSSSLKDFSKLVKCVTKYTLNNIVQLRHKIAVCK